MLFAFVLPMADTIIGVAGVFIEGNDYYFAWAGHEAALLLLAAGYFSVFALIGWRLFQKACGPALTRTEFMVAYGLLLGGLFGGRFVGDTLLQFL